MYLFATPTRSGTGCNLGAGTLVDNIAGHPLHRVTEPVPQREVPAAACTGLRFKSCLEPDRTLISEVENCSPAQHFALIAVTGYIDFVSGARERGGDVRCHDAVATLNR